MSDEAKQLVNKPFDHWAGVAFGFALYLMGVMTAHSSTYACKMRDDLGASGALNIGIVLIWVGAFLTGRFSGKFPQARR